MNTKSFGLIALMLVTAPAVAQDTLSPMRLSPVEIEDVSEQASGARERVPESQPSDSRLLLDLPQDAELLPAPSNREVATTPAENLIESSKIGTRSHISRLNKPISEIRLSQLPIPNDVSQPRFTNAPDRLITSSDLGETDSLQRCTVYGRRPLYFEDSTLERCGYSDCVTSVGVLTNVHSAAKFLIDTAALPYRMIKQRPDQIVPSVAK